MNFVVSVEFVSGKTGVGTPMLDKVVSKYPIHNIEDDLTVSIAGDLTVFMV